MMRRFCGSVVSGVLLLAVACGPPSGLGRTGAANCPKWDEARFNAHVSAFGAMAPGIEAALKAGTVPNLADPGEARVNGFSDDVFGGCAQQLVRVDGRGYTFRANALVFASWGQLSTFVTKGRSWAANAEADRRTTQAPSPAAFRTPSVGGNPNRTMYCLLYVDGQCSQWNLMAFSGTCRSLLVDIALDNPGGLDHDEAQAALSVMADVRSLQSMQQ
jgi:hypothetical protein